MNVFSLVYALIFHAILSSVFVYCMQHTDVLINNFVKRVPAYKISEFLSSQNLWINFLNISGDSKHL